MRQPLRSQSFRHRSRPAVDVRRYAEDLPQERRRSTPTVSRRCSLQRHRVGSVTRTDVWPEPKHKSEIEERFLQLPDSEDYTRVRQFKIDAKGAVVSRGDSFRRKRNSSSHTGSGGQLTATKHEASTSPFPVSESESPRDTDSRSTSVSSNVSAVISAHLAATQLRSGENPADTASTSHHQYKIYVLGQTGSGKSSLISQFITSEYRNAFSDEIEEYENTVSVNIGGQECDLIFFEADPLMTTDWKDEPVQAYVLVYSIDRRSSFRAVLNVMEELREEGNSTPMILAGNKADLERKRAVASNEVKHAMLTYAIPHFEISVALNHDVDDLLVGIIAEIKESLGTTDARSTAEVICPAPLRSESATREPEDFRAAIRRFSQRKKRQMGAASGLDLEATKCANLSPSGLFERFRQWRRGTPKC